MREPCPICLKREANVTDHDHASGLVRGRLCPQCNTAIGLLGDDCAALERAVIYLNRDPDGTLFADVKRERLRMRMREWRAKNPERDKANRQAWLEARPGYMREAVRRYRAKDADGSRAQRDVETHRRWVAANPDKVAEYNRRRREKAKRKE